MISVSLNNITLILGARCIFSSLNWEIQHDQKIGLIGANGAGKSSIFKLITGEYQAESGGVVKARGIRVGYLPQQPEFAPEQTPYEIVLHSNPKYEDTQQALAALEASLADPAVYSDEKKLTRALERHMALLEAYQAMGGDQYPQRVQATLAGLGMPETEQHKLIGVLSGGQKKLVGLAGLILSAPDVLLLDEPDNHLDLDGKAYLEQLIQTYSGAVVIISHDRYLLDAVATQIAELEDGRMTVFSGDYSAYMLDKQTRLARQEELFNVQQHQIARIETAIKRYAIWAKTYDNEKFAKRARAIQNRLDKMERIDRPITDRRRMELHMSGWRGSQKVLEFQNVSKAFDSQSPILKQINLVLQHGERVGMIGKNGTGKSVLFRLVLGSLLPDNGEIITGPSVKSGYYAQEHETLDPQQTILHTVQMAGNMSESKAIAFLNRYLFSYHQVTQKIGDLSGGERSRLQLALVVLSGANFLLLDEPTNNLDIPSAEVLEDTLADFEGTALIISHDRYFLDQVVQKIFVLNEGQLFTFMGNYSDYLLQKSKGAST